MRKRTGLAVWVLAVLGIWTPLFAAAQPAAGDVTPDQWPKSADVAGTTYTIYAPQIESWDGYQFQARAAVSVLPAGGEMPIFGVIFVTAVSEVDRQSRSVRLYDLAITSANFPSAPDRVLQFRAGLQSWLSSQTFTPSLDRMQASLAVEQAQTQGKGVPVLNAPPTFVFSEVDAALIYVDGEPVWRPVEGTSLKRVLNTRTFIVGDAAGKVYLHILDGFLEASGLSGPWTVARNVPPGVVNLAQALAKNSVVDLMEGEPSAQTKKKPSLKSVVPRVMVATMPTELILTQGPPAWTPITGTSLLYVTNTSGNVFKNLEDQSTYVLVTGRWFKARDFAGPWQFVDGASLPPAFAAIPDNSPKENVKASIPGTTQALEAAIANQIPQTARVDRAQAKFTPQVNGAPQMLPIAETTLSYVFNSPSPIIRVAPTQWYAVQNGVWFASTAVSGPWSVASAVPAVVYSIPPSSPVHYVTYLKVYNVTPTYVVVGYTPGYMGTIVTASGVVVYGTGYAYNPYIGATVWYGPPVTYGYAANPTWTPWTGWAIGFGIGWAIASSNQYCYVVAPYWGPMPYSPYSAGYAKGPYGGAVAWGPSGWAATTGNVYQKWGPTTAVSRTSAGYNAWTGNAWSNKVGTSYNSTTGRISAGQSASVSNVYTGGYANGQRGATYNPTTGVAVKGGAVTGGNTRTGAEGSAGYVKATGPDGRSAGAAKVGNTSYAGADGNVYKNSGDGWQKYDSSGGWTDVQKTSPTPNASGKTLGSQATGTVAPARAQPPTTQSLDAQKQARQTGDQRSAGSSWGSSAWGGGFEGGGGAATKAPPPRSGTSGGQTWGGGQFGGGAAGGGGGGGRGRR